MADSVGMRQEGWEPALPPRELPRVLRAGGLRPLAATGALVTLVGLLAVLTDGASEDSDLSASDPAITARVVGLRSGGLDRFFHAVSQLGDARVVVVVALVASLLVWWLRRDPFRALALLVMAAGPAATTFAIKFAVDRPRPPAALMLGPPESGYSFPSGHTTAAAALAAALCWVAWRSGSRRLGLAVLPVASLIALGVAFSRVYLGYHWATDVVGGLTVAAIWSTVLLTADQLVTAHPGMVPTVLRGQRQQGWPAVVTAATADRTSAVAGP